MQSVEHYIKFDERCPTHAVDKCQHLIARLETQVFDDRSSEHLSHLGSGRQFDAPAPRLAVDANADLHLVFA